MVVWFDLSRGCRGTSQPKHNRGVGWLVILTNIICHDDGYGGSRNGIVSNSPSDPVNASTAWKDREPPLQLQLNATFN